MNKIKSLMARNLSTLIVVGVVRSAYVNKKITVQLMTRLVVRVGREKLLVVL